MIVVRSLTKSFGRRPVLNGVTFEARPGEIALLVGPNGAGKSTTLKAIAGLIRPDSGSATLLGRDIVKETVAAQRNLAFLPQSPAFHPRFTCAEVLQFYGRLRGVAPSSQAEALALVGLTEMAHQPTGALSGGMRQRLGLALLLLPDAPVLILDEPGVSLDPDWRRRLQRILQVEAQRGKTILVCTHLIAEWNNVADRCLLCRQGAIERPLDSAHLPEEFGEAEGWPTLPQDCRRAS